MRSVSREAADPPRGEAQSAAGRPIGRASLLGLLDSALTHASERDPRLVLLTGEAGIGKTCLVRECCRRARDRDFDVAIGRGESGGAPAHWPWVEVLRTLVEARGLPESLDAKQRDLLRRILPSRESPTPAASDADEFDARGRFEMGVALAGVLREAARLQPLLVVLEDLHWVGPETVRLTWHIARSLSDSPVLLLATFRTPAPEDDPLGAALADLSTAGEALALPGLDGVAVSRFIEAMAGFEAAEPLCVAIHAHTGGNPLFMSEVVRLLSAEGRLGGPGEPAPEHLPLPETVRHTLRQRIARLSEPAQRALRAAAAIGPAFDVALLGELVPETEGSEIDQCLREAVGMGFVVEGPAPGGFQFGHELARATLYEDTGNVERARHHRIIGEALRRRLGERLAGHHAVIAHHLVRSLPFGDAAEAAKLAHAAGDEALERLALGEAHHSYAMALAALRSEPEADASSDVDEFEILIKLGRVAWDLGRCDEARAHHEAAAAVARGLEDAERLGRAALAYAGRTEISLRAPEKVFALAREALAALPGEDSPLRARLLALCARAHYIDGAGPTESERISEQALAMAERTADPAAQMAALVSREQTLMRPGGVAERNLLSARMIDCAHQLHSPSALGMARVWRIVDLLETVDIPAADREIASLATFSEESQIPFFQWMVRAFQATRSFMRGPLVEAERRVHEALAYGQRTGSPNAMVAFGTQLFHLREAQGRLDEVAGLMRSISEKQARMPVFRIGLPLIHAHCGRLDEAGVGLDEVLANELEDFPRDMHWLPLLSSVATVCRILGDETRAREILEHLRPWTGEVIVAGIGTYWAGPVDRWIADLESVCGEWSAAETHYDAAITLIRRAGSRPVLAQTLACRAEALHRRGRARDGTRIAALRDESAALWTTMGAPSAVGTSPTPGPEPPHDAELRRQGVIWTLRFSGRDVRLPDAKGLRYLAELLARPGEDVHVLDLTGVAAGNAPASEAELLAVRGQAGIENLDAASRSFYRARLATLREALDAAETLGDLGQPEQIREEMAFLEGELAAATGLGGRSRLVAGSTERARKAVSNRLRASLRRIAEVHPECGRHLEVSIRTGSSCCYRPEHPLAWRVES